MMKRVISALFSISRPVTRDDVIWCYRSLLGREPESEDSIQNHLRNKDFRDLVRVFSESPEFKAHHCRTVVGKANSTDGKSPTGVPLVLKSIRENDYLRSSRDGIHSVSRGDPLILNSPLSRGDSIRSKTPGSEQNRSNNAKLAIREYEEGVLVVQSTPNMLTLETTSRCNLRCVMCPHAINAVDRPKHLEDSFLEDLAHFISRASSIQLHGIGEPLISPGFWKVLPMLPPAESCGSSINTNLTHLDDRRLDDLLNSNIQIINVSLDAATAETYKKIRGFSYAVVLGNLEKFISSRRSRGKTHPSLYLNMTLMRSNIDELSEFVRLCAKLGVDKVCFWHLNKWSDTEMKRYIVTRDGWTFDYAKEGLWNFPDLSNMRIREAIALAGELGVEVSIDNNKELYY